MIHQVLLLCPHRVPSGPGALCTGGGLEQGASQRQVSSQGKGLVRGNGLVKAAGAFQARSSGAEQQQLQGARSRARG